MGRTLSCKPTTNLHPPTLLHHGYHTSHWQDRHPDQPHASGAGCSRTCCHRRPYPPPASYSDVMQDHRNERSSIRRRHSTHSHAHAIINHSSWTLWHTSIHQQLRRHTLHFRHDIILLARASEHTLRLITVSLALAVLLVRVLHGDVLVHQVLAVHVCDGVVGGLEAGVRDEAVAFREAGLVACDFWG